MMKTGVLFDLDGTLLDTLEDLKDGVNHALRSFGYPERTLREIREMVGNGARVLIARAVPAGAEVEPVLSCFQEYYQGHCRIKTKPYDGIEAAMECLGREYPLAIVSNKPDGAVKKLCAEYFPGIYAQGEHPGCPRKPAPDMLRIAMERIGAERCIYVGDSEVDVLTARNAGVPCLSVTWGFRDREELEAQGASCFCARAEELPRVIKEILKREGWQCDGK
ncbi:MAG: HAD-IA family hydrolase [Candidatus Faecousia sp.]|nr:HAD-IA family hydrolase [Candidatus Faecousia sp.]